MVLYDNTHKTTPVMKQRIADLAMAGIPLYLIAKIVKLDDETITKHYSYELTCSQAEMVQRIAKVVAMQAENGNEKSQALYLKTQGAKYGFVEKQVVESVSTEETKDLKEQIKALEDKYKREY
jgi:polyhydroxyalkanoate synthesis regulator phasin